MAVSQKKGSGCHFASRLCVGLGLEVEGEVMGNSENMLFPVKVHVFFPLYSVALL